jgi:hypothetical protein
MKPHTFKRAYGRCEQAAEKTEDSYQGTAFSGAASFANQEHTSAAELGRRLTYMIVGAESAGLKTCPDTNLACIDGCNPVPL